MHVLKVGRSMSLIKACIQSSEKNGKMALNTSVEIPVSKPLCPKIKFNANADKITETNIMNPTLINNALKNIVNLFLNLEVLSKASVSFKIWDNLLNPNKKIKSAINDKITVTTMLANKSSNASLSLMMTSQFQILLKNFFF